MATTNQSAASPDSQLFAMFNGSGPVFELILPAALMNVAGVPGVACNLLLIFATWRTKSMRGPTNYLLALTALFETLHQSAHLVFLAVVVSGTNFVPYQVALRFQCHSVFGLMAAQMAMVSTAADRLLAVAFPWMYNQLIGPWYLFWHTLCAVLCGGAFALLAIQFSLKHPDWPVTGYIADLLVSDMEVVFMAIMLLCAVNISLYLLVWMVVRMASGQQQSGSTPSPSEQSQSRLFRSLVVIISVVIGGYVANNVCKLVVNHYFALSDVQKWKVAVFGGILLNIGASAEAPTLYVFSSEYRRALNKQLSSLLRCPKASAGVHPVTVAGALSARHPAPSISRRHSRNVFAPQNVPMGNTQSAKDTLR